MTGDKSKRWKITFYNHRNMQTDSTTVSRENMSLFFGRNDQCVQRWRKPKCNCTEVPTFKQGTRWRQLRKTKKKDMERFRKKKLKRGGGGTTKLYDEGAGTHVAYAHHHTCFYYNNACNKDIWTKKKWTYKVTPYFFLFKK